MMNSRERVRRAFQHKCPDRPGFNFWMDRPLLADYERRFGPEFRISHYGADIIEVFPDLTWWEPLRRPEMFTAEGDWQTAPLVNSLAEALQVPLPDVTAPRVYEPIQRIREAYPETAIFVNVLSPLEVVIPLRLYDGLFLDLYDAPQELALLLDKIAAVTQTLCENLCRMDIDALYLMGDIAMKTGPMLSREHLKQYCFQPMAGCVAAAARHHIPVLYHSDGAVMDLLDLLVDHGFAGINPLQPHLNDLGLFGKRWSDKLVLYGGLDNCYIIPEGTPGEVAAHVRSVFRDTGGGGSLLFSTHDLPGHTPPENVETMIATIKSCRYAGPAPANTKINPGGSQ